MTSRFPAEALRPASPAAKTLVEFLDFLGRWEAHNPDKAGCLSESTATGLRVTISSTLSLLEFLTEAVGFKYLTTSRLSTDPVENLFGIVRQSSGCNAHPSPEQFLMTVNCLSFYNLARSVDNANANPDVINALLNADDNAGSSVTPRTIDDLLAQGRLDEADHTLSTASTQHLSLIIEKSDSRLIYYIAGYVACKCVLKLDCTLCKSILLVKRDEALADKLPSDFTQECDWGGLLYPSRNLFQFIVSLEDIFTECFSRRELHSNSICDVVSLVRSNFLQCNAVGCTEHAGHVSGSIVAFYVLTRLHFLVKGVNSSNAAKRQRAKHLKLSRTT